MTWQRVDWTGLVVAGMAVVVLGGCFSGLEDPTPLEYAVVANDAPKVHELLRDGADPNEVRNDMSVAYRAGVARAPDALGVLVEGGATVYGDERDGPVYSELLSYDIDDAADQTDALRTVNVLLDLGFSVCRSLVPDEEDPSTILASFDPSAAGSVEALDASVERLQAAERRCSRRTDT